MNTGMPPFDPNAIDPATGMPMAAADPALGIGAPPPTSPDPMMAAGEDALTRSAWSQALHEGMAAGQDIRSIMANYNPGMFGAYQTQAQKQAQAAAAQPQNPLMAAQQGVAPAAPGPSAGQFGMGSSGMMPPAAPPAPGFPAAPAQGMRPGPLGRLQQRMRPAQPGMPPQPNQQQPPSRQNRKNSRGR